MKPWKHLSFSTLRKSKLDKLLVQHGQSIVEFVLLLSAITFISWGFIKFMNSNLARYWEYSANLIVNDKPGGTKKLNLYP
jgi:hypothetical protein